MIPAVPRRTATWFANLGRARAAASVGSSMARTCTPSRAGSDVELGFATLYLRLKPNRQPSLGTGKRLDSVDSVCPVPVDA